MAKFYVTIEEVVEKTVLIEVDTEDKNEARRIYKDDENSVRVISEEEENGSGREFKKIYTEKEYLG